MECAECFRQIDKYINNSSSRDPIIVDVPNVLCLNNLVGRYDTQGYTVIRADAFVSNDTLLIADLKNALQNSEGITFLFDITLYLFLLGEKKLRSELKSLLSIHSKGKLIIITFACKEWLKTFDARAHAQKKIVFIDGDLEDIPTLNFYSSFLPKIGDPILSISRLNEIMPRLQSKDEIYIQTDKSATDYPDSIYQIIEYDNSYKVVSKFWPDLATIDENAGSEENWKLLLKYVEKYKTWSDFVEDKLPQINNPSSAIINFSKQSLEEQWVYYLAFRLYGVKNNGYLSKVVINSDTFAKFKSNCFQQIFSYPVEEKNYWTIYEERKKVLENMQEYDEEAQEFIKRARGEGGKAIYYFTDLNKSEKEQTIDVICNYSGKYSSNELISILEYTYPDLASYLSPFNSGNEQLDSYINLYKYCKVTNNITDEMMEKVDAQASRHEFINWLQPRSSIVDKLPKSIDNNELYFIDAMGVEYLSFLRDKCYERELFFDVKLARCELPSITSINSGFVKDFERVGYRVIKKKDLDKTKHGGEESYDFEKTSSPIYIVKELEILSELISNLARKGSGITTYIISDHGASRLAVLHDGEVKHELAEKGKHSGRCCPKSELQEKPEYAVEGNDFWCIANYNRFSGGRKAQIEVHGGATIEEVAVPIITVRKQNSIKCEIKSEQIEISYNKDAQITLYVSELIDDVSVVVDGIDDNMQYPSVRNEDKYLYNVALPNIKNPGAYTINVFWRNNIIAKGLKFIVKRAGLSEKKLF